MSTLPAIYTIQASDAPRHTGKLQEILQTLKKENRIGSFKTVNVEDDFSSITDAVKEEDLILIVLTHGLESQKEQIETRLKTFKADHPEARIAEIIVDNVPYENAFITFPGDLRPIRDRGDMDVAWGSIEQSLKELFPVKQEEEPVAPTDPTDRSKYLKIAGIVIGLILVFFIGRGFMDGDNGNVMGPSRGINSESPEPDPGESSASQTECVVTISNSLISLHREPDRFSQELSRVRPGEYESIDYEIVSFAGSEQGWFQIQVDGRRGWIPDDTFTIESKTGSCP